MIRSVSFRSVAVPVLLAGGAFVLMSSANAQTTQPLPYKVVPVVEGIANPWSIAFLTGGDMLVTEKAGRLRVVRNGRLLPDPVAGVPAVLAQGQGGLLDVVPHPQFATNRLVYISYSKPSGNGASTAVIRARFEDDQLKDIQEIFDTKVVMRSGHYGSRMAFDGRGFLFITVGDRQAPPSPPLEQHPAQNLALLQGKVIRLHDDGRVPADNPFVNNSQARPEIWSYGHRNLQGLAINPATGDVWETEHGPQGGDELNLILPGKNYGWPVIGYGVNYGGARIHSATSQSGMEQPANYWVPSIATSGLMIYTGTRFPAWRGNIFAGGLQGTQIARLTMSGQRVTEKDVIFRGQGRVRDIRQGPDGFIYIALDIGSGASIVRLEPAG